MSFPRFLGGASPPILQDKPVHVDGFVLPHPPRPSRDIAASLWSGSRFTGAGRDGITDLNGNPSRRLRDMLAETARRGSEEIKVARCVVIAMPVDSVRADRHLGFEGARDMFDELMRLHRDEYRGRIDKEERGIRYALAEHDGDSRRILIWTGRSVDIADNGEKVVEDLSLTWIDEDGRETALTVPPWRIPRAGADGRVVLESVPVGITAGQRVLFFGASPGRGAVTVPGLCGSDPEGTFFIDLDARGDFAEGGCGDGVAFERDGDLRYDSATGERTWTCRARRPATRPGGEPCRLVVSARPRRPVPAAGEGAASPSAGTRLEIVGVALPKIDVSGGDVRDWQLAVAADGMPTPDVSRAAARLGARDGRSDLFFGTSGRFDERLVIGAGGFVEVPLGGDARPRVHAAPGSLSEFYLGLLELARPTTVALSRGVFTIGRGRAAEGETRVGLDLLAIPGTVTMRTDAEATLGRLALSRRHLNAEVVADRRLRVSMGEGKTPAFHIDVDRRRLVRLDPATSGEVVLADGDGLIVGCYIVRFRAAAPP